MSDLFVVGLKSPITCIIIIVLDFVQQKMNCYELPAEFQLPTDKIITIGDIHGNLENLKLLLEKLKSFVDYTIVFLGDYIDRGRQVKETIQYLINFKNQRPQNSTHFLLGNHEYALGLFLGLWKPKEGFNMTETWISHNNFYELWNGTEEEESNMHLEGRRYGECSTYSSAITFQSYGCKKGDRKALLKNMPKEHLAFIESMPWVLSSPSYYFVHAGLNEENLSGQLKDLATKNISRSRLDSLCARRFNKISSKTVVSGHVFVQEVEFSNHRILLDTSGGKAEKPISAVVLDTKKVVQSFEKKQVTNSLKKQNESYSAFSYAISIAILLYVFFNIYGTRV
jgi:serine/threonine protein phosphatase 1